MQELSDSMQKMRKDLDKGFPGKATHRLEIAADEIQGQCREATDKIMTPQARAIVAFQGLRQAIDDLEDCDEIPSSTMSELWKISSALANTLYAACYGQ